jgi:cyclophilin family peptidyl-prolyl cis-trans isomerase
MLSMMLMLLAHPAAAEPGPGSAPAPRVRLETSLGTIDVVLYPDRAPETVKNFLAYVDASSYDGTVFHRVIPGFMIQGGGMDAKMNQRPTRAPIPNEARADTPNRTGTLAMARTNAPHSATAQFFINLTDNGFLNHTAPTPQGFGYAVFGEVVSGMDVVNKIAQVPTGSHGPHQDVPRTPVTIESAKRITP